jgi:putative beta-lysine N-acetyltransferase
MVDKVEKLNSSLIQHGKLCDRIYLMRLAEKDAPTLPERLVLLAEKQNYSKIFAKIPASAVQYFQKYDFYKEAFVPDFYQGKTGVYFIAKFLEPSRAKIPLKERLEIRKIIELTKSRRELAESATYDHFDFRRLGESDVEALAQFYKTVFKSYPFPIFDVDYLNKTLHDNVRYYGIFDKNKLIAACSADLNISDKNAEMTDFAVSPDYRAQNLALQLLLKMEKDVVQTGIKTFYTIARALSAGMNITFARAGYYFAGTLKNNTHIGGKIESMNVWYKSA